MTPSDFLNTAPLQHRHRCAALYSEAIPYFGQFLFPWMMPRRWRVVWGKREPPPATVAIAPIPKRRTSRRVQCRKTCGATSITCGGRSWKKLAGFRGDTDSVEDVLSASSAECSSSRFIVKSPPISPPSSTNLRSCFEACPTHQREPESHRARQRE